MRTLKLVFLLYILLSTSTSLGQQISGALEGVVQDEQGAPIPGAGVSVSSVNLQGGRTIFTGQDGRFYLPALPVGLYRVTVQFEGFRVTTFEDIRVGLGTDTDLGLIVLSAEVHELEDLVVTGRSPLIDPVSTTVGANLRSEEFTELPLDRNYQGLSDLLPHIQRSFLGDGLNFAGGTGMENKWFVDGVDATDPIGGGTAMELPYNFVREVQVRTGGYQAEYRGALGGVVDVITHSGRNEFHGDVFGYFLNDKLAGEPQLGIHDPNMGSFSRWDIGAGVGGAIAQDKLWYYLAYNPAFDRQETEIPGLGFYDSEQVKHRFAAKLDWLANDSNDFVLSVVGDPGSGDVVTSSGSWAGTPGSFANPDPLLTAADDKTLAASLKGNHYVGDQVLLQSTAAMVWNSEKTEGLTEIARNEVYFFDRETAEVSGGNMETGDDDTREVVLGLSAEAVLGAHTVKAGAEYREIELRINHQGELVERYDDADFVQHEWRDIGATKSRTPAFYLQDSWRLGQRLRLNFGLRWNGQYLVDSAGETAIRITDQWQPRAGATYLLGEDRTSKLFGSFGRFYQDLSLYAPGVLLLDDSNYMVTVHTVDPRVDTSTGEVDYTSEGTILDDLKGQYFDEFTLGYERRVGARGTFTLRGIYRQLGEMIEDAWVDDLGTYVWGNPGRGLLDYYPSPSRDYAALEFTFQISGAERTNVLASYVLSRNRGNTTGIFPSDNGGGSPNINQQWDVFGQMRNGHGLLPNDRTHVLKLAGSWRAVRGLTLGGVLSWQKGTPLNVFGAVPGDNLYNAFVVPRGTAGRTSSIWDLNFRIAYDLSAVLTSRLQPKLLLDLLHVGSQTEVTNLDQRKYLETDGSGNQTTSNPTYGLATAYQPPFAVRFGASVGF